MRELTVALALAGACAGPLGAYLATGAAFGEPIYSGWKLLFLVGTVAFSAVGLLGAVIAIYEPGWGTVLLGVSTATVFSFVFLIAIRDQPLVGSSLSAAVPTIPFVGATVLAAVRYNSGSFQEDDRRLN